MTRPRQTPCDRCRSVYTANRICENCAALGDAAPVAEDRFADLPKRQAPPPVMPAVGRRARSMIPTLDGGPIASGIVDRHAAITKLTDYIASGALNDMAVEALLAHAEILKGRAA